jgi:ribonuclease Z
VADILLLKKGLDVTNSEGEVIKNADATIDPPAPRSYAYCSDTIFNPKTAHFVKGVDVLYHESTFLEDKAERAKKTFHSTAKQAAQIASMAGVKQLLLGHFSARYRHLAEFTAEAEDIFKNCLLATDGKKIKI